MTSLTLMHIADEVAIAEFKKLPEAVVCIDGKEAVRYTPERTCHNKWDIEQMGRLRFQCSECGGVSLEITPIFCPCCGARVEGSEE